MARKKKLDPTDIAAEQRAREQAEVEQAFLTGINTLRDLIAPSSLEIHSSYFRLGTKYGRTLYIRLPTPDLHRLAQFAHQYR